MKSLFTILLLLCAGSLFAQQYSIEIHYDKNGNRILRERVTKAGAKDATPPSSDTMAMPDRLLSDKFNQLNNDWAGMLLFPNPTNGSFTLKLKNPDALRETCYLIVMDAAGREIIHQKVTSLLSHYNLSRQADGIYRCVIITGHHRKTVKIVKKTR